MFVVGIVRARELLGEWRTLVFCTKGFNVKQPLL